MKRIHFAIRSISSRFSEKQIDREWILVSIVLGAIELALLCFTIMPFVLYNNLQTWDMIGHLSAAEYTKINIWPYVFGWNPLFFCGYPENRLYPPFLVYGASTVGQVIGVPLAIKTIVSTAVLATPLVFYRTMRVLHIRAGSACLYTLAMTIFWAGWREEIGGTLYSTFAVGNLTNGIGLPIAFAYVASLRKATLGKSSYLTCTALLGWVFITHLVAAMFCIIFFLCERYWVITQDAESAPEHFVSGIIHAFAAIALSAFFIIPFVVEFAWASPDIMNIEQYPASIIEIAVGYCIFLLAFFLPYKSKHVTAPLAITAALVFTTRTFVLAGFLDFDLVLRPHRFKVYDTLMLILLASLLVEHLVAKWIPKKAMPASVAVLSLGGLALLIGGLTQTPTFGVPAQMLPSIPQYSNRSLIVNSPISQVSDHTVQHLIPLTSGNPVAKGLFVEAAANAKVLLELERSISHRSFPIRYWSLSPFYPWHLTKIRSNFLSIAQRLGFERIITSEPLNKEIASGLAKPKPLGSGYVQYQLPETQLVEVLKAWPQNVTEDYFSHRVNLWLINGGQNEIASGIDASDIRNTPIEGKILDLRISKRGDRYQFFIDAKQKIPVLVKTSYFPNFVAYDESGKQILTFRLAPYLIGVLAKGMVDLRYQATLLERASAGLSLIFLSFLVLGIISKWFALFGNRIRMIILCLYLATCTFLVGWGFRTGMVQPSGSAAIEVSTAAGSPLQGF